MSPAPATTPSRRGTTPRRPAGAALVIGLLLLAVITVLAISVISTASLELQMTGNEQYQELAFRAAEAGIEQAIAAGDFTTDPAAIAGRYAAPMSTAPIPQRGTGMPIAGCSNAADPAGGPCEYFLRFDHATGPTAIPGGEPTQSTGLLAYHFVVDSFGVAGRGAYSHQIQGFYVVAPNPGELTGPPVRTDWRQRGIDLD